MGLFQLTPRSSDRTEARRRIGRVTAASFPPHLPFTLVSENERGGVPGMYRRSLEPRWREISVSVALIALALMSFALLTGSATVTTWGF